MNKIKICDLCSGDLSHNEGYVFYSPATMSVPGRPSIETGLMHFCDECCDRNVNDQQFEKPFSMPGLPVEEATLEKLMEFAQEANVRGIAERCRNLDLTPVQAKEKARSLALLVWQDEENGIRKANEFWLKGSEEDKSCFIATACYGSEFHHDVMLLRFFRDEFLVCSSLGKHLVGGYYRYSPRVANIIRSSETCKAIARVMIVYPALTAAKFVIWVHSHRRIR